MTATVPVLAAIPYRTLPDFTIGPVTLRSFGLLVALGIAIGIWIAARYVGNRGLDPDQYVSAATKAVIVGLVGARLAWVLTHLDQIASPIDVIAVWEGGMQFSGGFVAAAFTGWLITRGTYTRTQRWHIMDGTAIGTTVGLAIGRIGCMAVGEHFGSTTDFVLGMTYNGGGTIEPVAVGETIHNTAFYEFLHMAVLAAIFGVLVRRASERGQEWPLGMMGAIFSVWYGAWRFLTDTVRIYDARWQGLTGAQWAGIALVLGGLWVLATMGNRRDLEGRELVPTTQDPQSAVKVVAGMGGNLVTTDEADTDHAEADVPDEADKTDETATDDVEADPTDETDVDEGDGATGTVSDGEHQEPPGDADPTDSEPPWAERAAVTDGSSGYRSGVRVMSTDVPDQDPGDVAATDEVDDGDHTDPKVERGGRPRGRTSPGGGHVAVFTPDGDEADDADVLDEPDDLNEPGKGDEPA